MVKQPSAATSSHHTTLKSYRILASPSYQPRDIIYSLVIVGEHLLDIDDGRHYSTHDYLRFSLMTVLYDEIIECDV